MSTCKELAARIDAHLKRFEADKAINAPRATREGTIPYYRAGAYASGRWVMVTYVAYQGQCTLTKSEVERYLAKLDAGFVGQHFQALREAGEPKQ